MGTSDETPKKSLAQKGQGMLEYALMMSFVAMVYLIVFADGGFGGAIIGTFDNANETLVMASEKSISGDFGDSSASGFVNSILGGGGSSSSTSSGSGSSGITLSEADEQRLNEISSADYIKSLNTTQQLDWPTLKHDIRLTFDTIIATKDPDRAIASEYNLFYQLAAMTNGKAEFIYKDSSGDLSFQSDGTNTAVGWNDLMNQIKEQTSGKSTSSYVKIGNSNEKLWISRDNKKQGLMMTYTNGTETKTFSLYAGKDAADKNIMIFESKVTTNGETTTTKTGTDAISEYGALSSAASIYNKGVWQFNNN